VTEETGWLVEACGGPLWWTGTCWTADSWLALRFARKVDAESYIRQQKMTAVAYATEHGWISP
jgi:hypothetical protein